MKKVFMISVLLIPPYYFGYMNNAAAMGLSIVAGAIAVCFMNLDRIVKFKGAGFEAEIRQVENVVKEAYATIDQLKKIGETLIVSTAYQIQFHDRLGNMSDEQELAILEEMIKLSKALSLDISENALSTIKIREKFKTRDKLSEFYQAIWSAIPNDNGSNHQKKYDAFKDAIEVHFDKFEYPSIDEFYKIIESFGLNSDKIPRDIFTEYEKYRNSNPYIELLKRYKKT